MRAAPSAPALAAALALALACGDGGAGANGDGSGTPGSEIGRTCVAGPQPVTFRTGEGEIRSVEIERYVD